MGCSKIATDLDAQLGRKKGRGKNGTRPVSSNRWDCTIPIWHTESSKPNRTRLRHHSEIESVSRTSAFNLLMVTVTVSSRQASRLDLDLL